MHKNRNKNRTQSPIKGITKSTVNLSGNAIGKKVTLSGADTQNIEKVQVKIISLEKKESAIKDGSFEFSNPIETVEMK